MDQLKSMVRAMAAQASRADALEREIETLRARNADADERIKRLMQILKAYDRARFGRRSEKLSGIASPDGEDAQQAFVFEEIETGISALRAQVGKDRSSNEKRASRPRKGFPPHLERVEVVIEPEELPEHAGKQKVLIGEDTSERLDVTPAKFRVIVTRRPKYAFKDAKGVIQALAPAHIIESGLPTEALLAQIAVSKYADGLPLFRQEGIYARDLVDLDRRLMAQWMGRVGFELEILAEHVLNEILKGSRIFADETSLPTLAPGTGAVKKAWLWAYARDDSTFGGSGPPMVAYRFEDSRSGDCVRRHLAGYSGILQVDGYAAYNKLVRRAGAMTARGWQDAGRIPGGGSMNFMPPGTAGSPPPPWKGWPSSGSLRQKFVGKAPRHAPPRVRLSRHLSSLSCSRSGSRPCRASRGNRSWPRRCAMPSPGATSSSAS